MKIRICSAPAALLVCLFASCHANSPPTDSLAVGASIGSYSCVKSGGIDDGVEVGKSLCYT